MATIKNKLGIPGRFSVYNGLAALAALVNLGVDIRDNVYGGGDEAEVTGDASVTIGKKKVETPEP